MAWRFLLRHMDNLGFCHNTEDLNSGFDLESTLDCAEERHSAPCAGLEYVLVIHILSPGGTYRQSQYDRM
jgi:hypothetical protein